jgi:hypothetical protein
VNFSKFWKFCSHFTLRKWQIDFVVVVQKLTANVFMRVEHVDWRQSDESLTMCSHSMRIEPMLAG